MGERWILAVDLGNGGPKVAVVSLQGEVRRTALRAVSVHVGLDGSATQDAAEWWVRLLEAAREAVEGAEADRDALHA
ncbi:MAG TPA: carbohydrate kinase, partial [Candidatus Angelobacter sp.]|nr:carbohydrate kinase [Candidatus Angelobacter sp.]